MKDYEMRKDKIEMMPIYIYIYDVMLGLRVETSRRFLG